MKTSQERENLLSTLRMAASAGPVVTKLFNEIWEAAAKDGAATFACYLIDHCEREVVTEEIVQRWLSASLVNPSYFGPKE